MSKIVVKWAARVFGNKVYVGKGEFRETKKLFILEHGSYDLKMAIRYNTQFYHDTKLLHDTAQEAIDALYKRKLEEIRSLRERILTIYEDIHPIVNFKDESYTQE